MGGDVIWRRRPKSRNHATLFEELREKSKFSDKILLRCFARRRRAFFYARSRDILRKIELKSLIYRSI